ncbi:MAG: hypothetical protein ACOYEG_12835 [Petrimonas sp.]|jgi:hypothetical protein
MKTIFIKKSSRKNPASELEHYLNLAYELVRDYKFVSDLMKDKELILSQPDEEIKMIGAMIYLLCKSINSDYEVTFSENGISVEIVRQ